MRKVLLGSAILCLALAAVQPLEAQGRGAALRSVGVGGGVGGVRGPGGGVGRGSGHGPGRTGAVDRVQGGEYHGGSPHGGWSGAGWRLTPRGDGASFGAQFADRGGRWGGSPGSPGDGGANGGGWNGGSHGDWQGGDRGERSHDGGRGGSPHRGWSGAGWRPGPGRGDASFGAEFAEHGGRGWGDRGGQAYAEGIGVGDGGWTSADTRMRAEAPRQAGTGATWRNPCRSFWWDGWSWRC